MKPVELKVTERETGVSFSGTFLTPETLEEAQAAYGESVILFLIESRLTTTLRHKVEVMLTRRKSLAEIQETLNAWKPTIRSGGRITEKMIRAEKDPAERASLIQVFTGQMNQLDDI